MRLQIGVNHLDVDEVSLLAVSYLLYMHSIPASTAPPFLLFPAGAGCVAGCCFQNLPPDANTYQSVPCGSCCSCYRGTYKKNASYQVQQSIISKDWGNSQMPATNKSDPTHKEAVKRHEMQNTNERRLGFLVAREAPLYFALL